MADREKHTIHVDYQMGGMRESRETGVYPEYYIIKSKKCKRRWKVNVSGDQKEKEGVLYKNKKAFYTYRVTDGELFLFDMEGNPVETELPSITMVD